MLNAAPVAVVGVPLPTTAREQIQKIVPQGWGFFTRSPRESFIQGYYDGDIDRPAIAMPPTQAVNFFGISRFGRGQPVEMANLVNPLAPSSWTECGPALSDCTQADSLTVTNEKVGATLCGELLFIQQSPTPWAYRDLSDSETISEKAVKLLVECP